MSKLFLIAVCVISLISFCSAISLGISPEKIELSGKIDEVVCGNFSIFGDNPDSFEGNVLWSMIDSRALSDYNSNYESINSTFPALANPGEHQFCASSKISGNYYGVLMYRLRNSSYGIGTWIELEITNNSPNQKISLLSGRAIQDIGSIKVGFIFFSIVLSIILTILLIKLRKKSFRINLNISQ